MNSIELPGGGKCGLDVPMKLACEGFKRAWSRLIGMDAAEGAKIGQLLNR